MTEQTSPLPAPDGTVETAAMRLASFSGELLGESIDPEFGTPPQQDRQRDDQGRFTKQRDGEGIEPVSDAEAAPSDDEPQADEAQQAQPGDDEEQYVEIPGEEGQEPTKLALSELVKAHQELASLNAGKAEVLQRVEQEAYQAERQRFQMLDQQIAQAKQQLGAFMQLASVNMPQPDPELLNPANPNYNPDEFHRSAYEARQIQARLMEAQQAFQQVQEAEKAARIKEQNDHAAAEWKRLEAAKPDLRDPIRAETWVKELRADLGKYFGLDDRAMADVIDHRFYLVAEKAIQAMKAQEKAPEIKKAIEAKPKLVNGRPPVQPKVREARASNDAKEALKKTGKLEAAAKLFERFA